MKGFSLTEKLHLIVDSEEIIQLFSIVPLLFFY